MYYYFFAYGYTTAHGTGNGMTEIVTEKPITTYDQVVTASDMIRRRNSFSTTIITSFQLLRQE